MNATPYYYDLHHGAGIALRALLNDLPFYRSAGAEAAAVTAPANHLLVPGENVLTLEIAPPSKSVAAAVAREPPAPGALEGVRFALRIDDEDDTVVHAASWPDPAKKREPPTTITARFKVNGGFGRPVYLDAPRARFERKGTPDQREAVREIYRALEKGDAQAFLRLTELKLAERERANPGVPDLAVARQRARLLERFAKRWTLRSVDVKTLKDLVFESRAEGRVAYVTRADGGPALEAVAASDPTNTLATDIFLTRVTGAWKVFR
jgi:hypothetical protein